ncbi:MAG TPA: S41 family peptidase [Caulobacteraceae bacterium]|jgi:hypothetical protein
MKRLIAALGMVVALAAGPALAQESAGDPGAAPEMAAFWRTWTQRDVDAAFTLVHDNHPGATVEVGDVEFQKALKDGYALAKQRAATVSTYDGYVATLAAFAWGFGDKHVWSKPLYTIAFPDWAGLIVSKQGDDWVITDQDAQGGESLVGAKLISCDGKPVNDFAREVLGGFRGVWSIGAQQVQQAPWLLIDEHNPFLTRPRACDFDVGGARKTAVLHWQHVRRDAIIARLRKAAQGGASGYGVRKVGDGYWIALQDLQEGAPSVVAQVKAQADALRAAPWVVLDVRGNGGGSSEFGTQIANILYGKPYVVQVVGDEESVSDCDGAWRVSPGNLRQLDFYQNELMPKIGPDAVKMITKINAQAHAAAAAGKTFSGPVVCKSKPPAKTRAAAVSTLRGRLVLLTDNRCFSSCLDLSEDFLKLGALHLGQTTDSDTRYSEVREETLPSGLSKFSTLQVITPDARPHQGPFVPKISYPNDIADTAALEAWVIKLTAQPPAS